MGRQSDFKTHLVLSAYGDYIDIEPGRSQSLAVRGQAGLVGERTLFGRGRFRGLIAAPYRHRRRNQGEILMMQGMPGGALSSSVLVLNRFYMAVHVINVRRAIGLLFRELAEVIHLEEGQYANYDFESWREVSSLKAAFKEPHDDWIQGINFELQVPRVIRLLFFDRVPRQTLRFNRRNIFARDGNQCQYCGRHFPTSELSLDHVVPRSRGGENGWENIVCACVACNVKKGGRTPHEAHLKLIRPPVKPKRSPLLAIKLGNPKYESWKTFLDSAYWSVDLK